jgi:hypothetical protein
MSREHSLTLVGIAFATAGSALGAIGILLQMNGYFAFRWQEFPLHMVRNLGALLRSGPAAYRARVDATVRLATAQGEDRTITILGLYCVMAGFLLQTIGSLLMAGALLL